MKSHPSDKMAPELRAQLFRLAGEEFAARGFEQASLNRIISAVGMSKSSFYHYFENKADLFRRMVEHVLAPFLSGFEAMDFEALTAETFWPAVRGMVRESTQGANRAPEMMLVSRIAVRAMDDPRESELTRGATEIMTRWLTALIRRGQALGLVRRDLPDDLLIALLMGMSTAFDRWFVAQWQDLSDAEALGYSAALVDAYERLLGAGRAVSQQTPK